MTDGKRYTIEHLPYNSRKLFQGLHAHTLLHIVRIMRYAWLGAILKELKSEELKKIHG